MDVPELELWAVASCLMCMLGNDLRPSARAMCALSCLTISPAFFFLFSFYFETEVCCIAQTGLKFMIFLPQLPVLRLQVGVPMFTMEVDPEEPQMSLVSAIAKICIRMSLG